MLNAEWWNQETKSLRSKGNRREEVTAKAKERKTGEEAKGSRDTGNGGPLIFWLLVRRWGSRCFLELQVKNDYGCTT